MLIHIQGNKNQIKIGYITKINNQVAENIYVCTAI